MVNSSNFPNIFVNSLELADFELLRPHLKDIELVHKVVLFETGSTVEDVYFPHNGIISLVVDLAEGKTIEAAMIGRDSIVGASSALNGRISLNKGIVQLPGKASILGVDVLRNAAEKSNALRTSLIRHEQALFVQAQQSAACNASHNVEARLCRWLLRARDLSGDDTLLLTQEFLGQMLGVERPSVSLIAHSLQQAGLIQYTRGKIKITNLSGLQKAACECYGTVKSHYDRLMRI